MSVIAFEPQRVQTAAQHYVRGRLSYPSELTNRVAAEVRLSHQDRVLDLGCGPGFLAVAFAPLAGEVVGVDPEPAMLAEAETYARERSAAVRYEQGSSYDLKPEFGSFKLVVMGRSFHWMDRKDTLERLDRIVDPHGAVVLFGDSHLEVTANAWKKRFTTLLEPIAKQDPAHVARKGENSDWKKHEEILLASPFSQLRRFSVIQELNTPVDRLLDRALSLSTTSPQRLGVAQDSLLRDLHTLLDQEATNGLVREVVESEALLAFRP